MSNGGWSATSGGARATTEIEVLTAIVNKIRTDVPILQSESVCFISDCPDPSVQVQSNVFCTVCLGNGSYDQMIEDGGGNVAIVEAASIDITVYSRIEVDRIETFVRGLVDPDRGLLTIKQQILASLAGKNLDGGTVAGISYLLLIESMYPRQSQHPPKSAKQELASFSLNLECKFNWLLSTSSVLV